MLLTIHSPLCMFSPSTDVQGCGCLPDITNGQVVLNPNTLQDSVATYSCNVGHELSESATRTCDMGTWSGAEPTCNRKSIMHIYLWWALRDWCYIGGISAQHC